MTSFGNAEGAVLPPDLRVLDERAVSAIEQALERAWPSGEVHLVVRNRQLCRVRTRKTERVDGLYS